MSYTSIIMMSFTLFTLLSSAFVNASDTCQLSLSASITMNTNSTEFFKEESDAANGEESDKDYKPNNQVQSLYKIVNSEVLQINNQNITLSKNQTKLINNYDQSLRTLVPKIRKLTADGIDLASDGVNLVLNDFLGEGNQLAVNLNKELDNVKLELDSKLSIERGLVIGVDGLESNTVLGKNIEQRLKNSVQTAVLNSMGSILMIIGQQMMFGDSEGESLDSRIKQLQANIEKEIAVRSEQITQRSQALCKDVENIDKLEEQLKMSLSQLTNVNVFTVTQGNNL